MSKDISSYLDLNVSQISQRRLLENLTDDSDDDPNYVRPFAPICQFFRARHIGLVGSPEARKIYEKKIKHYIQESQDDYFVLKEFESAQEVEQFAYSSEMLSSDQALCFAIQINNWDKEMRDYNVSIRYAPQIYL